MNAINSIADAVKRHADIMPEKYCVIDEEQVMTYKEFQTLVYGLAAALTAFGIRKKDRILIECSQKASFLALDMACEILGAIFVPIEKNAVDRQIVRLLSETDASLLIVEKARPEIPVMQKTYRDMLDFAEGENRFQREFRLPEAHREDTAEILYTTGTTGASKGIEITHENNIALAENIIYGTQMKADNVEFIPLPLNHSHGLRCAYANLYMGNAIVLMQGVLKVKRIFEMMETYRVTALDISPSGMETLLRLSKGKFQDLQSQLDYIQIGTAFLQEETKKEMLNNFPDIRLYNFYGSTESGRSCVLDFNRYRDKKNCVGIPTKNANIVIVDENKNVMESSKENPGLIASGGNMNMKGYWKQPELTRQVMDEQYVYTNDVGYMDEEGFVYVLGRRDDVINFKGIKVSPDEIEEAAKKCPGIKDCGCVPLKDSIAGQVPALFVEMEEESRFDREQIYSFIALCLEASKRPKIIEQIDKIPRTSNGKIERNELRRKLER